MVTSEKLHWRLHKHLKGLAKNRLRVRLSPLKSPRTFKDQSNRQFVILCISLLSLLQQYRNVLPTTIKKCLPKENVCVCVCLSVCHITFLSGYICSDTLRMFWHVVTSLTSLACLFWHVVTDINHVLTRCHVTEINYVDRGAAARAPLQYSEMESEIVTKSLCKIFLVGCQDPLKKCFVSRST